MTLTPGTRLGPYEILSPLGAGGMGEVYRAKDTKLNRDVALKILPDTFTHDPERVARFRREAQVLASLNHPHIGAIYGLDEANGCQFLVLELVDGESLDKRIKRGALPVDEALGVAKQIAEALEAAHEKGIIHRDLKPANIALTKEGNVKVLDFGLAKLAGTDTDSANVRLQPDLTQSPTMAHAGTMSGTLLGTAAYMSPEQARGKPVDKRADIWAFGVVLYEMLTGKRLFIGETITDVLSAVVGQEPDWTRIPVQARRLVKSCLQNDPRHRLHDIADVKVLLEEEAPAERASQSRVAWIAAAVLAVALGVVVALWSPWRTQPSALEPIRTQVYLPDNVDAAGRNFTLSPDGRKLAFSAKGSDGVPHVWVRFMDAPPLEVRELPGTETLLTPPQFFWSPDSRFIGYSAAGGTAAKGKLKKVDLGGSPPQLLCDTIGTSAAGGSWNRDGVIIFGSARSGLARVSESGGTPSPVTVLDRARKETRHAFPTFLPDGRRFLYLRASSVPENSGVYIGSLDAKPEEQDSRRLVATAFGPVYAPSTQRGRGYVLLYREGTVLAQLFDEARTEIVGDPVDVVQQVGSLINTGFFSASPNGVLVYRSGRAANQGSLRWWDRDGTYGGVATQTAGIVAMTLSPDGQRVALVRQDPASPNGDILMWDTARGNSTRVTFDPRRAESPVFSPDGGHIIFASNREGPWNLYRKPFGELKPDEVLLTSGQDKTPTSMSPDGRQLLYTQTDPQTKKDIWVLSNPVGGDRKSTPFLQREFNESEAQFSPGTETGAASGRRWVAYTSDEFGRPEVFVREFPINAAVGSSQVSKSGGSNPRWRRDGKELFFAVADGTVMSVDVTPGATFQASAPKLLVRVPSGIRPNWDVTPDGKRFLVLLNIQQAAPFTVWQNWQAALKK